jgi:hypothetical protein
LNARKGANLTLIGGRQHSVSSQPGNQYLLSVNINEYQKLNSESKSINTLPRTELFIVAWQLHYVCRSKEVTWFLSPGTQGNQMLNIWASDRKSTEESFRSLLREWLMHCVESIITNAISVAKSLH